MPHLTHIEHHFLLRKILEGDGESAGARTQDQRLKRAMLYQLSYALRPHFKVSTMRDAKVPVTWHYAKTRYREPAGCGCFELFVRMFVGADQGLVP